MGIASKRHEASTEAVRAPRFAWEDISALEVIVVAALIGATIWLAPLLSHQRQTAKFIGIIFAVSVAVLVIGSEIIHHEHLADVGLRFDNLFKALRLLALPTIGLVALLVATGAGLDSLRFTRRDFASIHWDWYGWMLIQQYLLQGFLNRRLQAVCGPGSCSVLLTAVFFAAFHLPNPALMMATFVAGMIWAKVFQLAPNIFAIASSHLVLSFVLSHSLPAWVLPNAKVGWAFHW